MTILSGLSLASAFGMFLLSGTRSHEPDPTVSPASFRPLPDDLYFPE